VFEFDKVLKVFARPCREVPATELQGQVERPETMGRARGDLSPLFNLIYRITLADFLNEDYFEGM